MKWKKSDVIEYYSINNVQCRDSKRMGKGVKEFKLCKGKHFKPNSDRKKKM